MDFVVGEELFGVVCCMGSGIVMLKYGAKQHLMSEMKQQKKEKKRKAFLFLNNMLHLEPICDKWVMTVDRMTFG